MRKRGRHGAFQEGAADTLERRRAAIREGGGADKLTARHEKVSSVPRAARRLFSPGTFQESEAHVRHCATSFGLSGREFPADGVITGTGFIGDLQVAAFSQDFTVCAGTLGKAHAEKMVRLMKYVQTQGVPLIAFRIREGPVSRKVLMRSPGMAMFYANVLLSGVVLRSQPYLVPALAGPHIRRL